MARRPRAAGRVVSAASPRRLIQLVAIAAVALVAVLLAALWLVPDPVGATRRQADADARAGRWEEALAGWRIVNRSDKASAATFRAEARAALALGRAGQADRSLVEAIRRDPVEPEPWLIRLERLRLLGQPMEAQAVGAAAMEAVAPSARLAVLRAWTLAMLSDAPDDLARATLGRWIDADPEDLDALAALDRRYGEYPLANDPTQTERIARLEAALDRNPDHRPLREALVLALAEAGEPERGRAVLDAWPSAEGDPRFARLDGRWALEYENRPGHAVEQLRRAVDILPIDRKSHYRLARAYQAAGQADAARREAAQVARFQEALEPVRLGRRLDEALTQIDTPAGRAAMVELCQSLDLRALADAWRQVDEPDRRMISS